MPVDVSTLLYKKNLAEQEWYDYFKNLEKTVLHFIVLLAIVHILPLRDLAQGQQVLRVFRSDLLV